MTMSHSSVATRPDMSRMANFSFVSAHPDMYWRMLGQEDFKAGRFNQAYVRFRSSSRYADKISQAMVAEMLWKGEGVAQDRSLAYAWMDLAAERGYKDLLVVREQYWAALSADERARALKVGEEVYAEFGDNVSKRRMDNELRRARQNITGSRTGHVGTLVIPGSIHIRGYQSPGKMDVSNLGNITDGAIYFADKYWEPKLYWQWQDEQWNGGSSGQVRVLPIEN